MRNRIMGAVASAVIAGSGVAGVATTSAPEVTRTARATAPTCQAQIIPFEDGSYAAGAVTVNGQPWADTFKVVPTVGSYRQIDATGTTLMTEWPVTARVVDGRTTRNIVCRLVTR